MASNLRWGILGTGNIAKQFAVGLKDSPRSRMTAVGSRSPKSAADFAKPFGIEAKHDYTGLLADPNVDAIYLSLPNSLHHEWTIKALRAGKHVLCEKPFALNAAQSEEMFDVSAKTGKVLVEAFMYRSHPYVKAVDEVLRAGTIGQVQLIRTSFCYRTTKVDGNVRFDRALGGGSLMDVGCYCINFTRHFAGAEPNRIQASAKMHKMGVDEVAAVTMQFPNGIQASFFCGLNVQADNTAAICGTEGYIEIAWPWKPQSGKGGYVLSYSIPPRQDQKGGADAQAPGRKEVKVDVDQDLYSLEADDFVDTVLDGAPVVMTRDDTLGNMRILDEIRKQIGLSFDS